MADQISFESKNTKSDAAQTAAASNDNAAQKVISEGSSLNLLSITGFAGRDLTVRQVASLAPKSADEVAAGQIPPVDSKTKILPTQIKPDLPLAAGIYSEGMFKIVSDDANSRHLGFRFYDPASLNPADKATLNARKQKSNLEDWIGGVALEFRWKF